MIKPVGIPKMLLSMALEPLPEKVALILTSGEDLSAHVWAFFDARVAPGRNVAVLHFRSQGATQEQAVGRIETAIKEARAKGSIFALGLMLTTDGLQGLLKQLGGDVTGLESIRSWCQTEVPPGAIRMALFSGATTQLQFVTV